MIAILAVCLALGEGMCAVAQQTDTAPAEAPNTASQTSPAPAGPVPEVRLEAHDGKTGFLLGERIQLDLVFRNTTGDAYTLNTTEYGDLSERKIEITPATGWFQWLGPSGHDYSDVAPLDTNEQRIPVVLNEGFVFREPGHYEVRVTTGRLSRGSGMKAEWLGAITTNSVGIDLKPMPEEVEAGMVRSLLSEISSNNGGTRESYFALEAAYGRLAALQGDDALHAKIHLILEEGDEMRQFASQALASTRNLSLQLSLLEEAWRDTSRAPPYDLMGELEQTRRLMRGQTQPGWSMVAPMPKDDEVTRKAAREAKAEHDADIEALIQSLPKRSGENRASTLYLLYNTMGPTAEQKTELQPVLVDAFPEMDSLEQHMLLETARPPLRDPRLVPTLRAMLDQEPTDKDAIARLIELDPVGAKPYVIRAVCDAKFVVPLEAVAKLPDATLPEVDGCLGDLLRKQLAKSQDQFVWTTRAKLAARFGTAAIVTAVREGWPQSLKSQQLNGAVLALLLRYAPAEAVASLKADATFNSGAFFSIDEVFKARHAAYPPELREWLLGLVKSGNEDMARAGAYELSLHGKPEDRAALEARLKALREKRATNAVPGAIDVTKSAYAEGRDADVRLEADLVMDLRGSRVWFVNNSQAAELARECASADCIHMGDPRNPDVPLTEDEQ